MRIMKTMLVALLLVSLLQAQDGAPVGNAAAGKAAWIGRGRTTECMHCHGEQGQGGFGPDLAGRAISFAQFKQAVRTPWGIMPAFNERQNNDQKLADIQAYLLSLPKVAEPAAWSERLPPSDAPRGQLFLVAYGCSQCHGPELTFPRIALGGQASEANFPHFAKAIYQHTDLYPDGHMGNYSRLRLPEPILQEIFRFATQDLGLLVPISAQIPAGVPAGANTIYTLTLKNQSARGKGLTAEAVTIALALKTGTIVVSGTGTGYRGVHSDLQIKSDIAVWQVPRIAPQEEQTYTLTIFGTGGAPGEMFRGSVVRWAKPEIRKGAPNLVARDPRIPGEEAQTPVIFPQAQP